MAAVLSKQLCVRVLGCALAVAVCAGGCRQSDRDVVPDALLGVWRTSARHYENCSFELARKRITFRRGAELDDANTIRAFTCLNEGQIREFRVDYCDRNGQAFTLALVYDTTGTEPAIFFKNQQQVRWAQGEAP